MDKINMVALSELKEIENRIEYIKTVKIKKLEVKVRRYLPIEKKIALANDVYRLSSEVDDNGYTNVNLNSQDIAITNLIVKYYTNIELSNDLIADYNTLIVTNVYTEVIEHIGSEYNAIMSILENIKAKKDLEYIKSASLDGVLNKIPMMVTSLAETLKDSVSAFIERFKKDDEFVNKITDIIENATKGVK